MGNIKPAKVVAADLGPSEYERLVNAYMQRVNIELARIMLTCIT